MYFLSFSKKERSFDFFSKLVAFNIIITSSIILDDNSSNIFNILSVVLLIIIIFSFSKRDFEKIVSKKASLLSKISFQNQDKRLNFACSLL